MRQKIFIILAVLLSFGVGILAGTKISKKILPQNAAVDVDGAYQAGWAAALKAFEETGSAASIPAGIEIKNISGTVQAVNGNTITLQVKTPGLMGAPDLLTRIVTVDAGTKIVQLVQKDQEQLKKELEAFSEKMKKQQTEPAINVQDTPYPPAVQDNKVAGMADIKVGQIVLVQSADDVRTAKKISATEIQIQQIVDARTDMTQLPVAPGSINTNTEPNLPAGTSASGEVDAPAVAR